MIEMRRSHIGWAEITAAARGANTANQKNCFARGQWIVGLRSDAYLGTGYRLGLPIGAVGRGLA